MPQTSYGIVAGLLLPAAGVARAQAPQPELGRVAPPDGWHVLVLTSDEAHVPASVELLDGFREVWQQSGERATIDTRHLDVARFAGTENDRELAKWLADHHPLTQ